MKKIPISQLIIEIDKLFFTNTDPVKRAETIEEMLKSTGYTWDDILNYSGTELN